MHLRTPLFGGGRSVDSGVDFASLVAIAAVRRFCSGGLRCPSSGSLHIGGQDFLCLAANLSSRCPGPVLSLPHFCAASGNDSARRASSAGPKPCMRMLARIFHKQHTNEGGLNAGHGHRGRQCVHKHGESWPPMRNWPGMHACMRTCYARVHACMHAAHACILCMQCMHATHACNL